jgi:hypothetical protein
MLLFGGAGLLVLAGAFTNDWGSSVVVRDDGDRTVARAALPESGRFRIEYMHSYYEVPATEHFAAKSDGSFELAEISSPSEAVLDYYELEGRKEARGGLFHLAPDEPRRLETLPLIGTEKGRRTLVVSNEQFPLYDGDVARHGIICVEEDTLLTEVRGLLVGYPRKVGRL